MVKTREIHSNQVIFQYSTSLRGFYGQVPDYNITNAPSHFKQLSTCKFISDSDHQLNRIQWTNPPQDRKFGIHSKMH